MDPTPPGVLADPSAYPGVTFGRGVILYGTVRIGPGTRIGDYTILGAPTTDHIEEGNPLEVTRIGPNVLIGPHCVIHNGAFLGARVRVDERSIIGWASHVGEATRILYAAQIHWDVKIGRHCIVGGFCCDRSRIGKKVIMLGKLIHRLDDPTKPWDTTVEPSPTIGHSVVIGFNALVIGGVTVRSRAYIAAGAIVTKNIPAANFFVGTTLYTPQEWKKLKRSRNSVRAKK